METLSLLIDARLKGGRNALEEEWCRIFPSADESPFVAEEFSSELTDEIEAYPKHPDEATKATLQVRLQEREYEAAEQLNRLIQARREGGAEAMHEQWNRIFPATKEWGVEL